VRRNVLLSHTLRGVLAKYWDQRFHLGLARLTADKMSGRKLDAPLAVQMASLKKTMQNRDRRRNTDRAQKEVWTYHTAEHSSRHSRMSSVFHQHRVALAEGSRRWCTCNCATSESRQPSASQRHGWSAFRLHFVVWACCRGGRASGASLRSVPGILVIISYPHFQLSRPSCYNFAPPVSVTARK